MVVIHKGVAYHLYENKKILDKNVLFKFAKEYMEMKDKMTRLPLYLGVMGEW